MDGSIEINKIILTIIKIKNTKSNVNEWTFLCYCEHSIKIIK